MPVTPLTTAAEVLVATDHDPYARGTLRRPGTHGWLGERAVVWAGVDAHSAELQLSALGEPAGVAQLVHDVLPELRPRQRVTVPRGTARLLPAWVGLAGTDWDFRWTAAAPPLQPGEERVVPIEDERAAQALLRAASPTASAQPGDADVVRWVGVPDGAGGLLACAADTTTSPSVGHLKSIAVHPDARGQGLGRAVTAALTRALLAQGCDVVTLGMYASNVAGRALYDALGFADDHPFTSGRLEVRSRW